jgi:23S rRNA (guanosine2251-2'-O)-methyltransferase
VKNKSIIFGIRVVIEAIQAGKEIDKVLVNKTKASPLKQELLDLMEERGIISQNVPEQKLNRITGKNHQGVIAYLSPITFANLENVIMEIYEKGEDPFLILLDGVTDVRNLGAIARTAECAGVHAIVVPEKGVASINEDAIKISAGALLSLPVCRVRDLLTTTRYLKDSGMQIYAATEKAEEDIFNQELEKGPCALIMGSEESGISNDIMNLTDARLKIPLMGKIDSLNVSVSAGIILYQIVRSKLK